MFFGNRMWNYTVKMIDGQFPDWHSVVPKTDATVLLRRQEFIDALQAVKKACDEENAAVKLTFNAEHLLIEAKSPKRGYAKTQVALSEVPPQMIIGLDADYLLEALNALTGEWIVFRFRSAEYGVELHDGAPNLRYHLVMPIDLGNRPAEPKEPVLDEKEEVWDGKAGKYVAVSAETKALAKTEFEKAEAKYKLDLETYKLELAQWRLAHRVTGWSDSESTEEEQKPGEFTPREGFPQIGAKLADHPSLEELAAQANTAEIAVAK
ncbi:partial Beta sliding clamp, partial [Planctomycetaceae bacterium]